MKCSEVMKRDVIVARKNDSLRVVAEQMAHKDIGFVPVVDGEKRVVGVVTDRDLVVRAMAHGLDPFHTDVDEVATHPVLTCGPDDELSAAESKMKEAKASRIVVVDGENHYQGVISLHDLAQVGSAGGVAESVKA